ncbi:MAG TPA: hypothetical protein VD837_06990 [Terriglobales bacterium]|nr:hypothetical protein [Terriglobales bacterium]
MIIEESKAVGAQAWFFREGKEFTEPEAGTAGIDDVPGADDDGWVSIGRIEAWEPSLLADEEQDVYDSSTGRLDLADSIPVKQALQYKFTTNVVTALAVGLFFRTASELSASDYQFNPLGGVPPRGWLKVQNYDHNSTLILAADLWGRIKVSGGMKGGNGELVKPEFMFKVFKNALNTMALGTAE